MLRTQGLPRQGEPAPEAAIICLLTAIGHHSLDRSVNTLVGCALTCLLYGKCTPDKVVVPGFPDTGALGLLR